MPHFLQRMYIKSDAAFHTEAEGAEPSLGRLPEECQNAMFLTRLKHQKHLQANEFCSLQDKMEFKDFAISLLRCYTPV